jgi:GDPmannose 4,6-dehydratase
MWLMTQQPDPDNYVIATGKTHSVEKLARLAFEHVGLDYREHVETDPALVRPAEVDLLVGDATLARKKLDWEPKVSFEDLIRMMVDADLKRYSS